RGDILLSQFEIPADTIRAFFVKGKEAGAITVLNPAPAKPGCEDLLQLADILVVNETELAFFMGEKGLPQASFPTAARDLRANPNQVVIVTLGAEGVLVLDGDKE